MSDEIVFSGFGIEIIKRLDRYFVRYDAGGIVVQMAEREITKDEADKARRSEQDAYAVILACQLRSKPKL